MPTLGLTGDVMLGRKVDEFQRVYRGGRPPEAVWGNVLDDLRACDGLLINLECAISDRGRQWTRTRRAFHFRAHPDWAVNALTTADVDCATLANNHALDFGGVALRDTLDHLADAGVETAGAGETPHEARAPATFAVGDLSVAVVGFTDNTPEYAATDEEDRPGVAYLDMSNRNDWGLAGVAIDRAREADPDLLVASLHWGPNNVTEPARGYREFGRYLVDRGVDLVHGHSAHVFQGIEVHDGTPICYDCGDFVNDYRVSPDVRNDRSFLFAAELAHDGTVDAIRLRPVQIESCAVHPVGEREADWWHETMRERSAPFDTEFEVDGAELVLPIS